jgi:Skp family chaperone for outer membrane proteins
MTHIMRKAILSAFLAVAVMAAGQAQAQMKMAVVDVQAAMAQSKAGQSIQKQVVTERKALEAEMKKIEKTLLDEQKILTDGREKMAQEEYTKKQLALNAKATESSRDLQARDAKIKMSASATMNELAKTLAEVADSVAKEGKYDLLLTRQAVVAAPGSQDITVDVIKALDKKVPDMKLKSVAQAKPAEAAKPKG